MCLHQNTRVIDSRERRRRRFCKDCGERFTTYEISPEEYEIVRKYSRTIKVLKLFVKNIKEIKM